MNRVQRWSRSDNQADRRLDRKCSVVCLVLLSYFTYIMIVAPDFMYLGADLTQSSRVVAAAIWPFCLMGVAISCCFRAGVSGWIEVSQDELQFRFLLRRHRFSRDEISSVGRLGLHRRRDRWLVWAKTPDSAGFNLEVRGQRSRCIGSPCSSISTSELHAVLKSWLRD